MNKYDEIDITSDAPIDDEARRQYYFIKKCRECVDGISKNLGRGLRAFSKCMGCQMNAKDSEKLIGILKEVGYEMTEEERDADLVIYNTCTVRENANLKVYGRLGALGGMKKKNKDMKIIMCGCMMQEPDVIEKIKKTYSFVDLVFGTHNIFKFAELLYLSFVSDGMIIDIWEDTEQIVEDLPCERKYSFKSGVNIMFGCNNFCSYCIVPYVRGRERSRKPEDIINEVKNLAKEGVVEVMLLGQNVNSYGKNFENPISFARLLQEIEKIDGIERIRFMTSHPKDLSDELIDVMKNSKKICRHLHLPLQSGSSRILKQMNRRYTKEDYLALASKIRREIPDIALTTDIIVGFPGETREDVMETIDVVRQVKFESAFTFIYSRRTGTPAAKMESPVSDDEIKENFNMLLKEVQTVASGQMMKLSGTNQEVLVENVNEQDDSLVTGRLSNNAVVHFPGDETMIGKIYNIHLKDCKGFYYIGERI